MPAINPKAILLDLDGTLADSLFVMRLSYHIFLKQFDRESTNEEFDSLNGPPLQEIIKRLKHAHSLNESEDVLLKNYFDIIDHAYFSVKPRYGAISLLQKAKKKDCTIGIVTSNSTKRTQTWLVTVGLHNKIDFIVSGDDVRQGKPRPEPYFLASQLTSCPPDEIVAIEDSRHGAMSAVSAGLKTFVLSAATNHTWPREVTLISSLVRVAKQLW